MLRACSLLLAAIVCGPPMSYADEAAVEELGLLLDSADFAEREAAVRSLRERGADAIDDLMALSLSGSPEVASRAVAVLEGLMRSESVETIDKADTALTTLALGESPHASALARSALRRSVAVREKRAVTRIEELGGKVQWGLGRDPLTGRGFGLPGIDPETGKVEDSPPLRPVNILLGMDWSGGEEGLSHLRKLGHHSDLQIYVVKGNGLPLAEVQALASVLPGLIVHERGPYLGVSGHSLNEVCVIDGVQPDSPAAAAGMLPSDQVLSVDDKEIRKFDDLVLMLQDYNVLDEVTIKVLRTNRTHGRREEISLKVELGGWEELPPLVNGGGQPMPPRQLPPNFPAPPRRQFPAPPPQEEPAEEN